MPCTVPSTECKNKCASVFFKDGNSCVKSCPTGKVPNFTDMTCVDKTDAKTILLRINSQIPDKLGKYFTTSASSNLIVSTIDSILKVKY